MSRKTSLLAKLAAKRRHLKTRIFFHRGELSNLAYKKFNPCSNSVISSEPFTRLVRKMTRKKGNDDVRLPAVDELMAMSEEEILHFFSCSADVAARPAGRRTSEDTRIAKAVLSMFT